jgi:hypothetical protein
LKSSSQQRGAFELLGFIDKTGGAYKPHKIDFN